MVGGQFASFPLCEENKAMDKRVKVPIRVRTPAVRESMPPLTERERDAARPARRYTRRPAEDPTKVGRPASEPGPGVEDPTKVGRPASEPGPGMKDPTKVGRPASGPGPGVEDPTKVGRPASEPGPGMEDPTKVGRPASAREPARETEAEQRAGKEDGSLEEWRDRALRLQAEIENFRKRQQRLAEERILADRERLLREFLGVADNLERALEADGTDGERLRQGVDLTHQTLLRVLEREGAEPIEAAGTRFDPVWHEAVGAVPHELVGVAPDTVAEVVEAGYRLGNRLLRPARVIVAT